MNCGQGTMKYFMIVVNALFVIVGIGLIIVGCVSLTQAGEYKLMLEDGFFSLPSLLITIGVFVTALFFFGCWGLKRESYCFMMTFAVLLGVILAMELIGGISAYVLRDKTNYIFNSTMEHSFNETYNPYGQLYNSTQSHGMWDALQIDGKCCGLNNYTDYYNLPMGDGQHFVNGTVPVSCCLETVNHTCNVNVTTDIYPIGCRDIIFNTVSDIIGMVAKWAILVAALHLLWIFGACYFAQMFRRRSYESV